MKNKLVFVDINGNEVEKEIECKPGYKVIVKCNEDKPDNAINSYLKSVSRWMNGDGSLLHVPRGVEITFVKFGDEDA